MMNLDRLRTILANERTLLAYIRTALAMLVFGMAAFKLFSDKPIIVVLGGLFMIAGVVILVWGIVHFKKISMLIREDK
jgi:putative membrane protein